MNRLINSSFNIGCLEWDMPIGNVDALIENHIDCSRNKLDHVAFQLSSAGVPEFEVMLRSLPRSRLIRLYASPNVREVTSVLTEGSVIAPSTRKALTEHLAMFVLAEGFLNDPDFRQHQFMPENSSFGEKLIRNGHKVDSSALMTNCGQFIDCDGILHKYGRSDVQSYSDDEARSFKQKIDLALDVMKAVSPEAFNLVSTFTTYINLRKNDKISVLNNTSHIGVGKIQSNNFHLLLDDFEEIIDFLIHESIHGYLHLVEEVDGEFSKEPIGGVEKVTSPWSGNKIYVTSFAHAIFVWYGLFNFWRKAIAYKGELSEHINLDSANQKLTTSARGFHNNNFGIERILSSKEVFSTDFRNVALACKKRVIATHRWSDEVNIVNG